MDDTTGRDQRPVDPLIGRQLGDFLVRRGIAEGGVGAIYLAEQPALGRSAVIKVLRPEHRDVDAVRGHFLEEARLAARLGHPYAAHVYAFGAEDDGLLWIAMEAVDGRTLARLVADEGPLSPKALTPLLSRLAEVIDAAHAKGIVHCDIKPSNVMVVDLGGTRVPKLLDFGIAATGSEGPRLAADTGAGSAFDPEATHKLDPVDQAFAESLRRRLDDLSPPVDVPAAGAPLPVGTPSYMAPERWLGEATPAGDIYALGVLLFFALTGRRPFVGFDAETLREAHVSAPVPPLGPGLEAYDPVLEAALAKRPGDRPPTATALAEAFASAGVRPRPPAEEAFRRLEEVFPRIRVESPVRAWAYLEAYDEGIEAWRRLEAPTPEDERWAGICFFQRLRDLDALECLERAVQAGDSAARMDLAQALLYTDDGHDRARELIESMDVDALPPVEAARCLRIRGSVRGLEDEHSALEDTQEAWRRIQGLPEYPVLGPWIAVELGDLSRKVGDCRRGVAYLDRAYGISQPNQRVKLEMCRLKVLLGLGLFEEVVATLERTDAPPEFQVITEGRVYAGEALLALGRIEDAREMLTRAADESRNPGMVSEEFLARVVLARLASLEGEHLWARRQLARAARLVRDRSDALLLELHEVLVGYRAGRLDPKDAAGRLDEVLAGYGAVGLPIEVCRARVHAYAIAEDAGDATRAAAILDDLDLGVAALDLEDFLAGDWLLWPKARAAAAEARPGLFPARAVAAVSG